MIGERIGNYVIKQLLGEGGMGAVYLAEHPQIGKKVALKVLHAELTTNAEVGARFFQEAKAVNDIAHPNIVDILDFGELPSSRGKMLYLVMELLAGTTLTEVVAKGALEPTRAVKIIKQVADALVASHERGIVHRDLKPDNIMLVPRGRDPDFVKLLDFGIAKVTGGAASKTRTGMVMGTPLYMSPEQCEGRGDIDHRTDIYALGIVLYELLTGRVPFQGDGYAQILVKHLTEEPPSITELRPGLSRSLEALVMKSLQKRREDRFTTMREMLDALVNPQAFGERMGAPPTGQQTPIRPGTGPYAHARAHSGTGPQEPTLVPAAGYNPTPAPGMLPPGHGMPTPYGASGMVPTPAPGMLPTPAPGMVPTPAPGMLPTPAPGMVPQANGMATPYGASGMVPTPAPGMATPYGASPAIPTPYGVAPYAQPGQTTLSQTAAELGTRAGGGASSKGKLVVGLIAGAAVIAGGIAFAMLGGKQESTASASAGDETSNASGTTPGESPATPTPSDTTPTTSDTTPTTPTAPTDPVTTPPPPTTPTVAKIAVQTEPQRASVFVESEAKERCKTPCTVELPRADGEATLIVKLAGYGDEKRVVSRTEDAALSLELAKKRSGTAQQGLGQPGQPGQGQPGQKPGGPKPGQVGDNTINPFDN